MDFPADFGSLEALQRRIAARPVAPWAPPARPVRAAGCFVCFGRGGQGPGAAGDAGWAAAAIVIEPGQLCEEALVEGAAGAPYAPGLLAAREGTLLARAVERLHGAFDVLFVNATGRDHPRRAGLAVHLGWALGVPALGVTHRPLCAQGAWPGPKRGARAPLELDGEVVGYWVRTKEGTRPLVAHAGWRIDADTAAELLLRLTGPTRTPAPLRYARRAARTARARATLGNPDD